MDVNDEDSDLEADLEETKGMGKLSVSGLFGDSTPDKEKPALKSKKFVAFLFVEAGFFTLMGMMLYLQEVDSLAENTSFMTMGICSAFLAVGYILGQSSLDRFVRVAQITRSFPGGSSSETNQND